MGVHHIQKSFLASNFTQFFSDVTHDLMWFSIQCDLLSFLSMYQNSSAASLASQTLLSFPK